MLLKLKSFLQIPYSYLVGVRNLPKIEKKASRSGSKKGQTPTNTKEGAGGADGAAATEDTELKNDIKPAPLGPLGSRKTSAQRLQDNSFPYFLLVS